jgi:hypothetical protein
MGWFTRWVIRVGIRLAGMAVIVMLVLGLSGRTTNAQDVPPEPGLCDGMICGPSGSFTVESFPTLTAIDWTAFPANPARPYAPRDGGRELFVGTDGSDANPGTADAPFATINHAAEVAQPGDAIWVAPGEYALGDADAYEGLILSTPGITLAAQTVGAVMLVPADPANNAIGIQAQADDLIIDGFVIRNFWEAGIEFGRGDSPQRNLVLKHLRVEQTSEGIRAAYVGDGSQPVIDGLLIYDAMLRDISLIGLQCGQGPCANMRFEALRIDMSGEADADTAADALAVESGENVVVFNAEITGALGDGIDLKSARNAVANVIVHDLGRNGIKLWHDGDVINALVYNTGADAAVLFEAGTYRVLNTLVARHNYGDSSYGMTVAYDTADQPGRLEIVNSVFFQNAGAIWVSPNLALDVRNSVFFGSGNGQDLIWDPLMIGADESPISALEAAGAGGDNLGFVDPLFADPGAGDYAWGADSPLLDAGTAAVDLPEFDLYGNPRVVGAGVDVGPVERQ